MVSMSTKPMAYSGSDYTPPQTLATKPLAESAGNSNIIPTVTWPSGNSGLGVASQSTLNDVARATARDVQLANIAAIGAVVPIVYGIDQIGARYLGGVGYSSTMYLPLMWCEACVGVQSLCNNNGEVLPTSVVARHYDGSQVAVDARLKTAYAADGKSLTDYLPGTCYSVLEIPSTSEIDPGSIIATLKGFRVFDPRDPLQRLDTPSTWQWSDNAALCLADFLSSSTHGYGKAVDWASVKIAADYCDELLADGKRRRTVNWAIVERMPTVQLIETLRTYAGCWVIAENSVLRLIPDRASDVDFVLTATDLDGVPKMRRRGTRETPSVLRVVYNNTSTSPYKQDDAYDPDPEEDGWDGFDIIDSSINLPGINSKSAARREARERRLKLSLGDLDISAAVKDIGFKIKAGQVGLFPHPAFPEGKRFRVKNTPTLTGPARYQIEASEYQPQMYCNDVFPEPEYPDTTLPDPSAVPMITHLQADERLVLHRDGSVGSRIVATWQPPDWPYDIEYMVELSCDGVLVMPMQTVYSAEYASPDVQEGKTYILRVAAKCRGFVGPWSAVEIEALGKWLPPQNVPYLTALEINGDVYLNWGEALDITVDGQSDVRRYEVRRVIDIGADLNAMTDAQADMLWQMGTVLDQVTGLRVVLPLQPPSTFVYMVKAIDSVGNYSPRPCSVRVMVTIDANARMVGSWQMGIVGQGNVTQWSRLPDAVPHWTTDHGDPIGYGHADQNDATGSFADLADKPFAIPHSAGTSYVLSHLIDVGQTLGGDWTATAAVTDHDGSHRLIIETSTDNIVWTPHVGALGQCATHTSARYVRLRIESTGAFTLRDHPALRLDVVPRTKSGEIIVGSNGVYTVQVPGHWASYVDVDVNFIGSDPYRAVRDDVIINNGIAQFNVFVFDTDNARAAGRVRWVFKGV